MLRTKAISCEERLAAERFGSRKKQLGLIRGSLNSSQTLLIAHNIDLAPRVTNLQERTRIAFYGEYEWNAKGGVIHWTHKDPRNNHEHGWLKYNGVTYQ